MRGEFLGPQELHRVRRHHRQAAARGQRQRLAYVRFAVRCAMTLQLQVIASGKTLRPTRRQLCREVVAVLQQGNTDIPIGRARERNQPVTGPGAEPVRIDFGPATVLVLQPGARQQLTQRKVAAVVAHQQQQPVRLVALSPVGEPNIATNQGFDAGSTCRLVEFDQTEQIAKIGQRQRRHAIGRRPRHGLVDTHDAITDGEFAVQPEMDKPGIGH